MPKDLNEPPFESIDENSAVTEAEGDFFPIPTLEEELEKSGLTVTNVTDAKKFLENPDMTDEQRALLDEYIKLAGSDTPWYQKIFQNEMFRQQGDDTISFS